MQRIAICTCLAVFVLAGCQRPTTRVALGPMPGPILSTQPRPIVKPVPPPPAREPLKMRDVRRSSLRLADIRPAGGIKKNLWEVIVVHHAGAQTATPHGMDYYHQVTRGWSNGLGYHFVIGNGVNYPDGKLYVGSRWERQIQGAHCATPTGSHLGSQRPGGYFNKHGIGICLIGDFEKEYPTRRQLQTLQDLIVLLVRETGISPTQIWGHGEITHRTACPGRHLNMPALRRAAMAAE